MTEIRPHDSSVDFLWQLLSIFAVVAEILGLDR